MEEQDTEVRYNSGLAIASLVCGICSLLGALTGFLLCLPGLGVVMGILAIVFGAVALRQTRRHSLQVSQ